MAAVGWEEEVRKAGGGSPAGWWSWSSNLAAAAARSLRSGIPWWGRPGGHGVVDVARGEEGGGVGTGNASVQKKKMKVLELYIRRFRGKKEILGE